MRHFLANTRRARWGLLCVLVAFGLNLVLITAGGVVGRLPWLVLYPLLWLARLLAQVDREAALALELLTGYWGRFVLLIGVLAWGICGLRPRDVGLQRGKWREALVATVAMWVFIQLVLVGIGWASGGPLAWHPLWRQSTPLALGLSVVRYFLGVGLFEEVFYRGLMLPQFYHALRERQINHALPVAVLLSQTLFALSHIPHYALPLPLPLGLLVLWLESVLLAWLWLRTGNLLILVGWHGLADFPLPLLAAPENVLEGAAFVLIIVMLVGWPVVRRRLPGMGG